MKKYFILLCSLAAVAVSCQKGNEATTASAPKDTEGQIVFAANTVTKSDFIEVTKENLDSFYVSSFFQQGDTLFFSDLKVQKDGGVFKTGKYSPAESALDFFAVYPYRDSIRYDRSHKEFYIGYKQNDSTDLVVSKKGGVTCPISKPVELKFSHALAQLKIKVRGVPKGVDNVVVLDSLIILDAPDSGTLRVVTDTTWVTEGFPKTSVSFIKDTVKMKSDTTTATGFTWLGGENFAKTFIPDGKIMRLTVVYHVEVDGEPVGESTASTKDFSAALKRGKRNTLAITLRPGAVKDIQFNIQVDDWEDYALPDMDF